MTIPFSFLESHVHQGATSEWTTHSFTGVSFGSGEPDREIIVVVQTLNRRADYDYDLIIGDDATPVLDYSYASGVDNAVQFRVYRGRPSGSSGTITITASLDTIRAATISVFRTVGPVAPFQTNDITVGSVTSVSAGIENPIGGFTLLVGGRWGTGTSGNTISVYPAHYTRVNAQYVSALGINAFYSTAFVSGHVATFEENVTLETNPDAISLCAISYGRPWQYPSIKWTTVYVSSGSIFNTISPDITDSTVRGRLNNTHLPSGLGEISHARVTMWCGLAGETKGESFYLGHASPSDFVSASDLYKATFGGDDEYVVPTRGTLTSDSFVFPYDGTSNIQLSTFYSSDTAAVLSASLAGGRTYYRKSFDEAGVPGLTIGDYTLISSSHIAGIRQIELGEPFVPPPQARFQHMATRTHQISSGEILSHTFDDVLFGLDNEDREVIVVVQTLGQNISGITPHTVTAEIGDDILPILDYSIVNTPERGFAQINVFRGAPSGESGAVKVDVTSASIRHITITVFRVEGAVKPYQINKTTVFTAYSNTLGIEIPEGGFSLCLGMRGSSSLSRDLAFSDNVSLASMIPNALSSSTPTSFAVGYQTDISSTGAHSVSLESIGDYVTLPFAVISYGSPHQFQQVEWTDVYFWDTANSILNRDLSENTVRTRLRHQSIENLPEDPAFIRITIRGSLPGLYSDVVRLDKVYAGPASATNGVSATSLSQLFFDGSPETEFGPGRMSMSDPAPLSGLTAGTSIQFSFLVSEDSDRISYRSIGGGGNTYYRLGDESATASPDINEYTAFSSLDMALISRVEIGSAYTPPISAFVEKQSSYAVMEPVASVRGYKTTQYVLAEKAFARATKETGYAIAQPIKYAFSGKVTNYAIVDPIPRSRAHKAAGYAIVDPTPVTRAYKESAYSIVEPVRQTYADKSTAYAILAEVKWVNANKVSSYAILEETDAPEGLERPFMVLVVN